MNPSLTTAPLAQRCLALTGSFETSAGVPDCYAGMTGDFDGQGLSLGVAQWNIGQGTLQPLLAEMLSEHEAVMSSMFRERLSILQQMLASDREAQLVWARSIQDSVRHVVIDPWKGLLKALCRTPEFQAIQTKHSAATHSAALALCNRFGVTSERAVALMFDIRVQNHSINLKTEALIRKDFSKIPGASESEAEILKLCSIANRRAEAANPQFVEDVRRRKLTIANGKGTVHGISYDLEQQFRNQSANRGIATFATSIAEPERFHPSADRSPSPVPGRCADEWPCPDRKSKFYSPMSDTASESPAIV